MTSNLTDKFYVAAHDGGGAPLPSLDDYFVEVAEPSAFDGGTVDARGNDGGANDPYTLFNVTGDVIVRVFGVCTTDLAGATATLQVGTAVDPDAFIASTTATDIDTGELWHDASPDNNVEATTVAPAKFVVNGADIVETVGTADVTGGNVYYVCLWRPVTKGSKVVSAV